MPELIHTCYRIGDIDRSVAFYEALGFEELRRMPIRDEAINVFMGLPDDGARLELTYNHGVDSYELGTGYNHIAITASDLDATLAKLAEQGIEPEKPPYTRARGRLSHLLRARSRRLPGRAHRERLSARSGAQPHVRTVVAALPAASPRRRAASPSGRSVPAARGAPPTAPPD